MNFFAKFQLAAAVSMLCGLTMGFAGDSSDIVLFRNGKTDFKICSPERQNVPALYAQSELADWLGKISGAKFEICSEFPAQGNHLIILGTPEDAVIKAKQKELGLEGNPEFDEVSIRVIDGNLYIAGSNRRSVLFGVYFFLKQNADLHFFWAGDTGTFFHKLNDLTLSSPSVSYHHKPSFRFREMSLCIQHFDYASEIFLSRNGVNCGLRTDAVNQKVGSYITYGGHSVGLNKEMFAEHPDWFCLKDGKRDPNGVAGCWTNPEFFEYMVKTHAELIKKHNIQIFSVFPADVTERCECAECTKVKDRSSRWFVFYEKFAERMKQDFPNVKFVTLAYQEYRDVPDMQVKNVEYVEYCQYNRCYIHKCGDPSCTINPGSFQELARWQEKAPMAIYGYEFDVTNPILFYPFWNMVSDEMKYFRDHHIVRMKTEYAVNFGKGMKPEEYPSFISRLPVYLYTQLMWDADADVNKLIEEYCRVVFGPGAKDMYDYFTGMANRWDNLNFHITYFLTPPEGLASKLLSDDCIAEAHRLFDSAEQKISKCADVSSRNRMLADMDLERKFFAGWEHAYRNAVAGKVPPIAVPVKNNGEPAVLPMRKSTAFSPETRCTICRDEENLYIQMKQTEDDFSKIKRGQTGSDATIWSDDGVEIFLDFGKGYRHIGTNMAGGHYAAVYVNSAAWTPKWKSTCTEYPDKKYWELEIVIPFSELGETPKAGDKWLLIVNRNHRSGATSYPCRAYHDMAKAGEIVF